MRAFLFDLDDTILNYSAGVEPVYEAAAREGAAAAGLDPASLYREVCEVRAWFWGDPERHRRERVDMPGAWLKIFAEALRRHGCADAGLAARVTALFERRRWEVVHPLPGARACLDWLRARGVPLGLVTNGDAKQQREKLHRSGFEDAFGAIVIEGEFGRGKPDPEVFLHALERLGCAPEEAWMAGDNLEFDVGGAQRLGLKAVWVDWRGEGLPAASPILPERVVRDLAGLRELLEADGLA
ncbi:MAG: HAD family hydrolase [Planctomycetota bacterium]|nr:HAD family hydrolase [Planctomycetota bacterium]